MSTQKELRDTLIRFAKKDDKSGLMNLDAEGKVNLVLRYLHDMGVVVKKDKDMPNSGLELEVEPLVEE